jgi:hypothetical protein
MILIQWALKEHLLIRPQKEIRLIYQNIHLVNSIIRGGQTNINECKEMMDYLGEPKQTAIDDLTRYVAKSKAKSKSIRSYRSVRSQGIKNNTLKPENEKRFNEVPSLKARHPRKIYTALKNKTIDEGNINTLLNDPPKTADSRQSVKSEVLKTEIISMLEALDEKELETLKKSLSSNKQGKGKFNERSSLTEQNLKDLEGKDSPHSIKSKKQSLHSICNESQ